MLRIWSFHFSYKVMVDFVFVQLKSSVAVLYCILHYAVAHACLGMLLPAVAYTGAKLMAAIHADKDIS